MGEKTSRPIVLIHGWAQSSACWGDEVLSSLGEHFRVVAIDLRGHGYSGAPSDGYDNSSIWAGDVQRILDAECITRDAVLLGWSYGGLVICDFLAHHGTAALSGVILVGAVTSLGRGEKGGRVGPAMRAALPDAVADDPGAATIALGTFCEAIAPSATVTGAQRQLLLGLCLVTPPRVRAALFDRTASNDEVLERLDVPALLIHGCDDAVVDISSSRHAASLIPCADESYWEGVAHGPFVIDPARFVSTVRAFMETVQN
ncbi:alpha/beta hydrolase [Rhodococcus ruber]|uniref:Alpha/beta hydrolase n=1 Tax=Rhodococcus ruber TaxID=1830 RepID=A0ABT4ML97_9NOCA|nr:alpha/beta hydrolase [Rhodococcus ruber]MCZ4521768.1 alpha/beta hydrolase [Rhodococcus ruber]